LAFSSLRIGSSTFKVSGSLSPTLKHCSIIEVSMTQNALFPKA
jgi:hypothetical protein